MKAIVVGGGLAGLAAALELTDGGASVTLLEARPRLGGATFSFERDGRVLDNGQHVALRCCTEYLAFLGRIGAADRLPVQRRLRVPVLRAGKPAAQLARNGLPAPLHMGSSLLRYGPLSLRERLSAIRAALALRRLDPDDPSLDDRTFGDWLRAKGQSPRTIAALWDLICLPTVNLPADEASLAAAAKVFRTGLLDTADACDLGVPAVPLSELHAEPAAATLAAAGAEVRTSAPVRAVQRDGERLQVQLDDATLDADAVVVAVPHTAVAKLVPDGAVDAEALEQLGTSPIVNVHVHYDRRVLDEPFAAVLDSPLQWLFDRTESSGTTEGQLVAISLSHAVDESGRSVAELRERLLPELERVLPAAREATVLDVAVTHEPRATFRAAPGSRRLRPGATTSVPGLYLAGSWTDTGWPATMESAVRSGVAAARAALAGAPAGAREAVGATR
ncbi:MAG TPA: hydroxysqualene dehydroxylase HpnE [Gaiellaceae bacterium]|nr:hydroxysqualene dehydroxylase HpnE [Gaiellaceae bacterium]